MLSKQQGNTLAEMLLIGGLVALASIGALTVLGGNLGTVLNSIIADMSGSGAANAAVASGAGSGPNAGANASGGAAEANGPAASKFITLSDGTVITIPGTVRDWKATVETTGANGTTLSFAQTLSEIAKKGLETGTLSVQQAGLINQLAERGYKLADIEAVIEQNMPPADELDNPDYFKTKTVVYDGQTQTLDQLASQIGWISFAEDQPAEYRGVAADFNNLLTQVQSSGALNDPTAKEIVNYSGQQILNIADGLETAVNYTGSGRPGTFGELLVQGAQERDMKLGIDTQTPPSVLTEAYAGAIDAVGTGAPVAEPIYTTGVNGR